jgi:hypothetical protein
MINERLDNSQKIELLFSNRRPLKTEYVPFYERFEKLLAKTRLLRIAVGYISVDSATLLKNIISMKSKPMLELIAGMHHFDGITETQLQALKYLNSFLQENSMGNIFIASRCKFHGKLYSFNDEKDVFASVIGSSNLDSIIKQHIEYEADLAIYEKVTALRIDRFIQDMKSKICTPFDEWEPSNIIKKDNPLLQDLEDAEKINEAEYKKIWNSKTELKFEIPLKVGDKQQKSNLNVYFGKGREHRGLIRPRHWYETELIVPNEITSQKGYPEKEPPFTVYTDDGWKFKCKVSGDFKKNFRSYNDLQTLGKWIKGRLEHAGLLKIGSHVTEQILEKYGRKSFSLIKTNMPDIWLLDFRNNYGRK